MAAIPQNLGVPTGTIMWSAAPEPPVGWLLCDGRFVTPGDQPALYAYIGNTYGGDSTAFALPDLVGRFILGVGDPGRQPFTYEDGVNKEHIHGMFKNQTHIHGVTDPQHEHPTSSGAHEHDTESNHNHPNTANHKHFTPQMKTHTYILINNCSREVYAPDLGNCSRDSNDFFITEKGSFPQIPFIEGKTGITAVNSAFTGTSVEIAFTGVTLANQVTGITLQNATTGISVNDFGVVGGTRPYNIAFLPIIRT
jgi:microcystin-dependent protein